MSQALRRSWHLWLPIALLLVHWTVILAAAPKGLYKDERLFYGAQARNIGGDFKRPPTHVFAEAWESGRLLEAVRGYNAQVGPLFFLVSGLWVKLGAGLTALRLLNAAYTCVGLIAFAALLRRRASSGRMALAAFALFLANPYLHLVSVFYYTDAFYFMLFSLALAGAFLGLPWLYGVAALLLPAARQIGILTVLGKAFGDLVTGVRSRMRAGELLREAAINLLPLALLISLFALWGGPTAAASSNLKMAALHREHGYVRLDYLFYYFSACGFYLLPLLLLFAFRHRRSRLFWLAFLAAAAGAALFPYTRNLYHNMEGNLYFNLARRAFGPMAYAPLALTAGLFGGCYAALLRRKGPYFAAITLLYFAFQSVNKMIWDKYLLDILPVILLFLVWDTEARPPETAVRGNRAAAYG